MNDNNKDSRPEEAEKDSGCSFGCLIGLYIIFSLFIDVLWVVWLIQGRPDTWYGKLFRLQYTLFFGILAVFAVFAVIFGVVKGITSCKNKNKSKKEEDEEDENE